MWAAGIVVAAARAPDRRHPENRGQIPFVEKRRQLPVVPPRSTLAVLIPRWAAHRDALSLCAIPAVAFVLAVSFLRNAPGAIQSSLYIVYLGDIGLSATLIGALIGISELFGVVGTLVAAAAERVLRPHLLVVICIVCSITAIVMTPLIASAFALLVVAAGVRGAAQGMSQPVMYSLLGKAVPPEAHGASVGVRNAVTRLASIITPAVMGVAAEGLGIAASFYIVGGFLFAGTAALAIAARRLSASGVNPP